MSTTTNIQQAADLLLAGWRDPKVLLDALPDGLKPADAPHAYGIQQAVMAGLGEIGGWKVGSPNPTGPCNCAPLPAGGFHKSGVKLPVTTWHSRKVEGEIAVKLGSALPAREAPYTEAEVLAAIESVHPVIEVVESRFRDMDAQDALSKLADLGSHGCFVYGPAVTDWQGIDFAAVSVTQTFAGREVAARTANPGGGMARLIAYLADEGAVWAGGLQAGQFVTTGSWTGMRPVALGEAVVVAFTDVGSCEVTFV